MVVTKVAPPQILQFIPDHANHDWNGRKVSQTHSYLSRDLSLLTHMRVALKSYLKTVRQYWEMASKSSFDPCALDKLPNAVKAYVDAEIVDLNAMAIVVSKSFPFMPTDVDNRRLWNLKSALFAGGLLTLAQLVASKDNEGAAWDALRFFTYSAVMLSFSDTFLCLLCIARCTYVPSAARREVLLNPNSWPTHVARGGTLTRDLLNDNVNMIRHFSLGSQYRHLKSCLDVFVGISFLFSSLAVSLWVWLTLNHVTAGLTMLTMVPTFGIVFYGYITLVE